MINKAGLDMIKRSEGCVLKAYPDPATKGEPYTIGYGATFYEDGSKVKIGEKITQARADKLLAHHVSLFSEQVDKLVTSEVNANQFAALVSFAFNCGIANLQKSTLLKRVNANPNDPSIRAEFMKWNKAAGKVMNGLTKRREEEANLYFSKDSI